jgi:DtxR family Mn-dependent transcriptional regulator
VAALVARLERRGLVETRGQAFTLTPEGERVAIQVVRAHRLWERYLADEARLPLDRLHQVAERREHDLTPDQVDRLEALLGHPTLDPHGDPIPTREGEMPAQPATPLTSWRVGATGVVVHLEDEPPIVYAQLVAEGLRIGQAVRLVDISAERVVLTDGENEFRLAPVVAGNVFLTPLVEQQASPADAIPLCELSLGGTAEIVALAGTCRGYTRRRLLDLGFTPGTRVSPALDTFAGDPRAYRVRGTTIALRRDQAEQVLVRALPAAS